MRNKEIKSGTPEALAARFLVSTSIRDQMTAMSSILEGTEFSATMRAGQWRRRLKHLKARGETVFKLRAVVTLALACWSGALMGQMKLEILPAAPRFLEPVYVRIHPDSFAQNPFGATVSMAGNKITVRYFSFPDIGSYTYDVELGRFPAGSYSVEVIGVSGSAPIQFNVADAERSPQYPGSIPAVNYSDIWWTPSESGWGLSIVQGPTNTLFAVWFAYDASGKPVWYTLQPGEWTGAAFYTVYTGPIYKTTGPYFGGPFNPDQVGIVQVGSGTLSFRDSGNGTFRYTIEGVGATKSIVRMAVE